MYANYDEPIFYSVILKIPPNMFYFFQNLRFYDDNKYTKYLFP